MANNLVDDAKNLVPFDGDNVPALFIDSYFSGTLDIHVRFFSMLNKPEVNEICRFSQAVQLDNTLSGSSVVTAVQGHFHNNSGMSMKCSGEDGYINFRVYYRDNVGGSPSYNTAVLMGATSYYDIDLGEEVLINMGSPAGDNIDRHFQIVFMVDVQFTRTA